MSTLGAQSDSHNLFKLVGLNHNTNSSTRNLLIAWLTLLVVAASSNPLLEHLHDPCTVRVGGDVGWPTNEFTAHVNQRSRSAWSCRTKYSDPENRQRWQIRLLETGAGNSERPGAKQLVQNWCGPGSFNCLIKVYCLNKWFIKNFNYPQGQIQDIANFILTAMLNFDTRAVHVFLRAQGMSKRLNFSAAKWVQLAEAELSLKFVLIWKKKLTRWCLDVQSTNEICRTQFYCQWV